MVEQSKARFIHPTAEVSSDASVGEGTRIWHQAQVCAGVHIGRNCVIGKGAYVDLNVIIGNNVKVQNGCFVYHGSIVEDGVLLGPHVVLTNDKFPRAINPDGSLKTDADWQVGKVLVKRGASLGAGVIVLTDVAIGSFAMIGAGSVVTKDVPDYGLAIGNPARLGGFVCRCGRPLKGGETVAGKISARCSQCGTEVIVPADQWKPEK